jgi:glucans biosynthesis protein C
MSLPQSAPASITTAQSRDISFDYLKATLVLLVVVHHSYLAYTTFAHFDPAHPLASTVPVVDTARWWFFDYAENFNDVFFMSLMFFISGLFVWPSLRRSGPRTFLLSRLLRLGLPFAAGVLLVIPLAYYASWQLGDSDAGYLDFWLRFITQGRPPGPLWFIWVLLFFDILAAGAFLLLPRRESDDRSYLTWTKAQPLTAAAVMFGICATVYLPVRAIFGPLAWGVLFIPPLYFQISRFGLYLAWFSAGAWLGNHDPEWGLLARDGALARNWPWWCVAAFVLYNALVLASRVEQGAIQAILGVASCVASCFAFLALFRGAVRTRRRWMDSLSRSAYIIYLVHYVYVLWLQRALIGVDVHPSLKFLIVLTGTVLFSWLTAQCLLGISWLRRIL